MCYSAEASLATFGLGFGFSLLLTQATNKFHRLLGYFLGYVSLMQMVEYLLWKHPICDDYNKTVSIIGMALNHLQPIVLAALAGLFYFKQVPVLIAVAAAYLAVIIPYSLQFTSDLQCTVRQCGATDPHIVWNWNSMKHSDFVYLVFLGTFVTIALFGMPRSEGLVFASVAVFTYTLSALVYDRKVMGSLWCFWTAFMPAGICLSNYLF
jgi:hypothetical protein